jgi:hypothetical protein
MYTQSHFRHIADRIAAMPVHSESLRTKVRELTNWHVKYFSDTCPKFKPEVFYNAAMRSVEDYTSKEA